MQKINFPFLNKQTQTHKEPLEVITLDAPMKVLLFNDNVHTFDEVIHQLIKATLCTSVKAEALAMEVHTTGKANCFEGDLGECLKVSGILEEIALHTQIEP